ncbi:Uncharacterised protein [Mycobacterium tuberculosis]|nr:Uncharacterised protein [Mycobacterium tuberculosis]
MCASGIGTAAAAEETDMLSGLSRHNSPDPAAASAPEAPAAPCRPR